MLSSTDLVQAVTADLEKIRETAPLVLSLTNSVVQPLTANLLLAIGAVPAMLNDAEEAVDMLRSGTGALLVNLGTVTREQGAAMQTAVREANRLNIPWVLDPVAVGALSLRTRLAEQLKEQSPRIIRGNASEIMALAGYSSVTKGPESTSSSADALHAARELALHTGAAVLVTGRTDYSTDGRQVTAREPCPPPAPPSPPPPCRRPFPRPYSWALPEKWPLNKAPPPVPLPYHCWTAFTPFLRKTLSAERAFFPFDSLLFPGKQLRCHAHGLTRKSPEGEAHHQELPGRGEPPAPSPLEQPAPYFQAFRLRSRKRHAGDLTNPGTAICLCRPQERRNLKRI